MTITVQASDVRDAQHQIHTPSGIWVQIQPTRRDFNSDGPPDSFEVKCSDVVPEHGTFSRVLSAKEAITVVAHLIREREKHYKAWLAARNRRTLADKRKTVAAARKAVKEAQARLKHAEGGDL